MSSATNPFIASKFVSHKGDPKVKPTPEDMSEFVQGTVGKWISIPPPLPKNTNYLQKEAEKRRKTKGENF